MYIYIFYICNEINGDIESSRPLSRPPSRLNKVFAQIGNETKKKMSGKRNPLDEARERAARLQERN